jgi:hypothetical protein
MITKLSVNDRHSTSICPSNVTRDILERREKQFVSKEVLTKRRYVFDTKGQGFFRVRSIGLRGQDDQSWTMKYARLRRSKVKSKSTKVGPQVHNDA